MKICLPIKTDEGLESKVFGHFGSAPLFFVADTDSGEYKVEANNNQHHEHGNCQPLAAIAGFDADAIVVGGIGAGALNKLSAGGLQIFRATFDTVAENIAAYKSGKLPVFAPSMVCAGHSHDGDCSH
jgi:predicted Fe-Mo cluster-binding NifX family protein